MAGEYEGIKEEITTNPEKKPDLTPNSLVSTLEELRDQSFPHKLSDLQYKVVVDDLNKWKNKFDNKNNVAIDFLVFVASLIGVAGLASALGAHDEAVLAYGLGGGFVSTIASYITRNLIIDNQINKLKKYPAWNKLYNWTKEEDSFFQQYIPMQAIASTILQPV